MRIVFQYIRIIPIILVCIVLSTIILVNGYLLKMPIAFFQKALHGIYASKIMASLALGQLKTNDAKIPYLIADWLGWSMLYGPLLIENTCVYLFKLVAPYKEIKNQETIEQK